MIICEKIRLTSESLGKSNRVCPQKLINAPIAPNVRNGTGFAGNGIAVHVDADGRVTGEAAPAECFVEQQASGSIDGCVEARGHHLYRDTQITKCVS